MNIMKIIDLAEQIYKENGSRPDTSEAAIQYWIRTNVGKLNAMLYEEFYLDETSQDIYTVDGVEIGDLPAAIIKMMYKVYRADLDIQAVVSGLSLDTVLEAGDQEFKIKRVNRSEVLKTITQIKNDTLKEQADLVHNYRSYHAAPSQVAGDDTTRGVYQTPSSSYVRNINTSGGN